MGSRAEQVESPNVEENEFVSLHFISNSSQDIVYVMLENMCYVLRMSSAMTVLGSSHQFYISNVLL